jgi:flagellar protein FliT
MNNTPNSAVYAELLGHYHALLPLSKKMLAAAQSQEWDQLAQFEQERFSILEKLKVEDTIKWKTAAAEEKGEIIRAVLAIDIEVKALAQAHSDHLQGHLNSISTGKKMKAAYESS